MQEPVDAQLVSQIGIMGGILLSALIGVAFTLVLLHLKHKIMYWVLGAFFLSTASVLVATVGSGFLAGALSRWGANPTAEQLSREHLIYGVTGQLFLLGVGAFLLGFALLGFLRDKITGGLATGVALLAAVELAGLLF